MPTGNRGTSGGKGLQTGSLTHNHSLIHQLKSFYGKSTSCEELCKALSCSGYTGAKPNPTRWYFVKCLTAFPVMEKSGDIAYPNSPAFLEKANHWATRALPFPRPAAGGHPVQSSCRGCRRGELCLFIHVSRHARLLWALALAFHAAPG